VQEDRGQDPHGPPVTKKREQNTWNREHRDQTERRPRQGHSRASKTGDDAEVIILEGAPEIVQFSSEEPKPVARSALDVVTGFS
jgi:hypothetical protein